MIDPPALPREHGAWVMLALPLVLGVAIGWRSPAAWCVPPAAVLAFLSHYALVPVIQRARGGKPGPAEWTRARRTWGALYLAGAGAAFAAAVLLTPSRTPLLALAGGSAACASVYFAAAAFGEGRAIWSELVGMAGMALAAPLTAAAAGNLDARGWTAAAIAYSYFLSSVAFVRAYVAFREDRAGATVRCILVHGGIALAMLALAVSGRVPAWPLMALAPPAARTAWGLARPPANLRSLGLRELAVAVLVALGAVVTLANGGAGR